MRDWGFGCMARALGLGFWGLNGLGFWGCRVEGLGFTKVFVLGCKEVPGSLFKARRTNQFGGGTKSLTYDEPPCPDLFSKLQDSTTLP